jgi:hypothetical protein
MARVFERVVRATLRFARERPYALRHWISANLTAGYGREAQRRYAEDCRHDR